MASEEESIPQTSTVKVTAQAEGQRPLWWPWAREAMPSVVTISTMSVEEMRSFFGGTQEIQVQGAGHRGDREQERVGAAHRHQQPCGGGRHPSSRWGFVDQSSVEAQVKGH